MAKLKTDMSNGAAGDDAIKIHKSMAGKGPMKGGLPAAKGSSIDSKGGNMKAKDMAQYKDVNNMAKQAGKV